MINQKELCEKSLFRDLFLPNKKQSIFFSNTILFPFVSTDRERYKDIDYGVGVPFGLSLSGASAFSIQSAIIRVRFCKLIRLLLERKRFKRLRSVHIRQRRYQHG